MQKILILGGTKIARLLAESLGQKHKIIYSIAGATQKAKLPRHCQQIRGGFGGAEGLGNYIQQQNIDLCIDATHPFAQNISRNAVDACNAVGIPIVEYARKAWQIESANIFKTEQDLIDSLPSNANILLTVGGQNIKSFLTLTQPVWARMIEPPKLDDCELPKNFNILLSHPPYALDDEMALMQKHKITHLICKNSGGEGFASKLTAAQKLDVKIVMLSQPPSPHNIQFFSIDEIEHYLNNLSFVSPS